MVPGRTSGEWRAGGNEEPFRRTPVDFDGIACAQPATDRMPSEFGIGGCLLLAHHRAWAGTICVP